MAGKIPIAACARWHRYVLIDTKPPMVHIELKAHIYLSYGFHSGRSSIIVTVGYNSCTVLWQYPNHNQYEMDVVRWKHLKMQNLRRTSGSSLLFCMLILPRANRNPFIALGVCSSPSRSTTLLLFKSPPCTDFHHSNQRFRRAEIIYSALNKSAQLCIYSNV